jgi:hypothetical protein
VQFPSWCLLLLLFLLDRKGDGYLGVPVVRCDGIFKKVCCLWHFGCLFLESRGL